MSDFEDELISLFYSLSYDYYKKTLVVNNVVDFPLECNINYSLMPFTIYNQIWAIVKGMLDQKKIPLSSINRIFKNAYYNTYIILDDNNPLIREKIEMPSNDSDVFYKMFYNDYLVGAGMLKACIRYLFEVSENPQWSEIVTEEIIGAGKEDVIEKFKTPELEILEVDTYNNYYRKMLYEYYTDLLIHGSMEDDDLWECMDLYFFHKAVPDELINKYAFLFTGADIDNVLDIQRRLLLQAVFLAVVSNKYDIFDVEEFTPDYFDNLAESESIELPDDIRLRWCFYGIFFTYGNYFNLGDDIKEVEENEAYKYILQKIYPGYFVDRSESFGFKS